MNPLKTTLTGSLGIKAGLGLDTVTLDLENTIPHDAVTIVLKGDNGSAKSTLMNLAFTPWREPPQLAGSIYDHFGAKGSRDLVWAHAGKRYHSILTISQTKKTRKQTAILHEWHTSLDEWQPVELPDHTTSDGKTSTYDTCLTSILGPQDIYYLAAFRAQNAPQLAEYGDPKALMRHLLNLDEPVKLRVTAQAVARDLSRWHEDLRASITAYEGHGDTIASIMRAVQALTDTLPSLSDNVRASTIALGVANGEHTAAIAGDLKRQRIIKQRDDARRALIFATEDADNTCQSGAAATKAAQSAVSALKRQREDAATHYSIEAKYIAARLAELAKMQADKDTIAAAGKEVARIEVACALADQTVQEANVLLEEKQGLLDRAAMARGEAQRLADKSGTLKAQITGSKNRAGFVNIVPCHGDGAFAACPALKEAQAAAERARHLESDLDAMRADWQKFSTEVAQYEAHANSRSISIEDRDQRQRHANTLRGQARALQSTASKADMLKQADRSAQQWQTKRADLDTLHQQVVERLSAEITTAETAENEVQSSTRHANEKAYARAHKCREACAAFSDVGDDNAVTQATAARAAQAQKAFTEAGNALTAANAALAANQVRADHLREELASTDATRQMITALEAEIAIWKLLAAGLAGVVDLTIEASGPEEIANDLLRTAYGYRFSLRIVTQRQQQNGKLVECFDISAVDGDSGIESTMLMKSGGESVWLDKALTDAIAIYQRRASGIEFECLFADESEDGLTEDRKKQFYAMDRRGLELGGYSRKFTVSHNPHAWSLADYVIDMESMRATTTGGEAVDTAGLSTAR